jgi:UDP:flavonoid glycosyltransferase YjiC (YdhE family)
MNGRMTAMLGAIGDAGHALPVMALGRALRERGHEVVMETSERWRETVEELDLGFVAAEESIAFPFPTPDGPRGPGLAQTARSLLPLISELRPDVVVSDVYTLAPSLAAEAAGVPRATLIHHTYPVHEPGRPFLLMGLMPPRTFVGSAVWRALHPLLGVRLRSGGRGLNKVRAELGLPPLDRPQGAVSEWLAIVATFPQLEYPRRWPSHVHVTGPMLFEPPTPDVEVPAGWEPLVLVAASSTQDPESKLVRAALEALEGEPVRVVATTGQPGRRWPGSVPANAVVVDWVSHAQLMPLASLVVSNGGHGTVARALSEGVPVLVCPAGPDQAENGIRAAWAGAGLLLPKRFLGPGPIRRVARRLLADQRFAARAGQIAAWSRDNDGAAHAAQLVECYTRG